MGGLWALWDQVPRCGKAMVLSYPATHLGEYGLHLQGFNKHGRFWLAPQSRFLLWASSTPTVVTVYRAFFFQGGFHNHRNGPPWLLLWLLLVSSILRDLYCTLFLNRIPFCKKYLTTSLLSWCANVLLAGRIPWVKYSMRGVLQSSVTNTV